MGRLLKRLVLYFDKREKRSTRYRLTQLEAGLAQLQRTQSEKLREYKESIAKELSSLRTAIEENKLDSKAGLKILERKLSELEKASLEPKITAAQLLSEYMYGENGDE